ncbi:hypothetical protein [uncultured Algoriphagus sp.]|tara:strand:+ start:567 stop:713 length:147 start_codon:yes stop_codon:yes gene_type:complete
MKKLVRKIMATAGGFSGIGEDRTSFLAKAKSLFVISEKLEMDQRCLRQ